VTDPEVSAAVHAVESCLEASGAPWRRVAAGEWGLRAQAGGWPLDVGIALRGGWLRIQAPVLRAGAADPAALLHRNRRLTLARLAATRAGEVWLQADLPLAGLSAALADRALGIVLEEADAVRAGARES
jgi:hypothetical protein